ncbi:DUF2130 domain-containing protein [Candidatus Roizmanbacteria bacterium]|nr:DUF2130 domain-containing protein [Candidatus Roizmanbacteria bacterium]
MNDQVKCPHCGKIFPMTQAISHLVEKEKLQLDQERDNLRSEAQKWRLEQIRKFEDESHKKMKEIEEKLRDKLKEEMSLELKDKSNEIGELRKQNKTREDQLLELNRLIRGLKNENEKKQLQFEKKLSEAQDKIRGEEKKRIDDEYKLKILEKDKKLLDALKMAEEYKRKLEQGSQQLQGDILELELKNILKREFPYDEIKDVPTGIRGADVLQIVKNNYGKTCGTIIWESKRTKSWSDGWINKLKEDQRRIKVEVAVIVSQVLPDGVKHFTQKNGVWIGNYDSIEGLGLLLRNTLLELSIVKSSIAGKQEKKEILWNYLTSIEFRQRLEAIYDSYQQAKIYLDKEKEFFRRKWAREEKNIELQMENLLGVHGDLQAIIGRSLPEIKGLDRLPSGNKEDSNTLF